MKPLKVEFAPPRRLPAGLWYAAAALLLGLAAHQGGQALQLWRQARAVDAEVVTLRATIEQARQAQRDALQQQQVVPPYAKDAADIAKVAAFPIERVFASVESAQVPGVKLVSFEIWATEGMVRLELEFSDHAVLLQYVEALDAGEDKPRWRLVRAQSGAAVGSGNSASLSATW